MTSAASKQRDKLQASVMRLAITRWIRDATNGLAPAGKEPLDQIQVIDMADEDDGPDDGDDYPRFAEGTLTGDEPHGRD